MGEGEGSWNGSWNGINIQGKHCIVCFLSFSFMTTLSCNFCIVSYSCYICIFSPLLPISFLILFSACGYMGMEWKLEWNQYRRTKLHLVLFMICFDDDLILELLYCFLLLSYLHLLTTSIHLILNLVFCFRLYDQYDQGAWNGF